MGRQGSPKGQVFLKKEPKLSAVAESLPPGASDDDFVAKFQELYPDDWDKICNRYEQHERLDTKDKGHPMPPPRKYLLGIAHKHRKTIHHLGSNEVTP